MDVANALNRQNREDLAVLSAVTEPILRGMAVLTDEVNELRRKNAILEGRLIALEADRPKGKKAA